MYCFRFKGMESTDLGVVVENPPALQIAQPRTEVQKVIGSAKLLHYSEGDTALDPVTLSLECALVRPDEDAVDELCAWLRGGGELVVPGDEDHYYKAWVKNQIDMTKVIRRRADRRFTVQFEREGFRYRNPPAKNLHLTVSGTQVKNPGTAPSEPLIKITGSGDVALTIGANTLTIYGITDWVQIDCEAQIVYRENVNLGVQAVRTGDWITIPAGGAFVSWTGTVTEVEIAPRWRDY